MIQFYAPVAILMLNGRRYRRMLALELGIPISRIKQSGIEVRFDPQFEYEQRSNAVRQGEAIELGRFSNRSIFTCDITGDQIRPDQGAVLSPWELRRSPLVEIFKKKGNRFAEHVLEAQWDDWVVS